MLLCSLLCTMIILQPCVVSGYSCGLENVSGAEGGEAILRVPYVEIKRIHWILVPKGELIVTTVPGRSIDDIDVMTEYRGRVRSEADGSLHIYNLSLQDRGRYRAHIRTSEDDECVVFNLTVYERLSPGDIRMTPTITRNGSCSLGLLCSVDKPDVMITWSNLHGGDVNVTGSVLYVPPSDVTLTYICTAHNPVSNVSKTVTPGEYCETARKDFTPRNLIRLILSGIVLLLTGCVFIHHLKTEVMEAPGGR